MIDAEKRVSDNDTIAAVATPLGSGGVGIVRISGPEALNLGRGLFCSLRPAFKGIKPYRLHHGRIMDGTGRVLDEVLLSYMPGPGSYTGEDVVEINCHGGPAVVRAVLEAAVAAGARTADAGEFTRRAFMNGRMDLTQAEAVAEMIASPARAGMQLAAAKLGGLLGERIRSLRDRLERLRAQLCLAVDFPDEDVDCLSLDDFDSEALAVSDALAELLSAYERGRCWREGAMVVLAGRVNAGKSSLLNAMLGRKRAIVTELPGTTRDYLEESLNLDGLPVRLVDTAGLRETGDIVEQEGVRMSRDFARQADVVLLVMDITAPVEAHERELLAQLDRDRVVGVLNKADAAALSGVLPEKSEAETLLAESGVRSVRLSAKSGDNIEELFSVLREMVVGDRAEPDPGELVPNLRQSQAVRDAVDELRLLRQDIAASLPYDLLGVRLETACMKLSEITGDIVPDDILNAIFEKFCIGK